MKYQSVIGLEIHCELSTKSKMFCGCTTSFGGSPNAHCCPICIAMPGVLPVLNIKAVDYAIKAGLALNCTIEGFSKMDRKNYFYPDLPKAYQASQYNMPICTKGHMDIVVGEQLKRVGITRIHLEEDAGKLLHDRMDSGTLVDYNRGGVPLIEIVTEPDMRSAEEARVFLESLKSVLQYIDVSDCKMQEGSLRCDVNISVRPEGQAKMGTRVEIKNMNSFRAAYRAMEYEADRQKKVLEQGGVIEQETRRWDDVACKTYSMRSKEDAHDYMYFPEPDLAPIIVDKEWVERIRKELPELPAQKKKRYVDEYALSEYDAGVLTSFRQLAILFEECLIRYPNPKTVSNWLMGDFLRLIKDRNMEMEILQFSPQGLAKLITLVDKGIISGSMAKAIFEEMFDTGKDPDDIVEHKGLKQISNEEELLKIVEQVIAENPKSVQDYKDGKQKAMGFLVGQAMKASRGKANPQLLNEVLAKRLDAI